jgi:hypothetical protein
MSDTLRLRRNADGMIEATRGSISAPPMSYLRDRHYTQAARFLDIPIKRVVALIMPFAQSEEQSAELPLDAPPVVEQYRVRKEQGSNGTDYATFAEALRAASKGDVVEWDSADRCAALDMDFHSCDAASAAELIRTAETLHPRPFCWWITKHGGLRLMYSATERYTAADLAAVAGFQALQLYPLATLEINHRTRFPPGEYHWSEPDEETGILGAMCGTGDISPDVWQAYCDDKGYTIGGRYGHSLCPVSPSDRGRRNVDPVCVYSDHVHCYICAADGIRLGGASPGYFGAASLIGGSKGNMLRTCVDHFTHWDHARYVLEQVAPNVPSNLAQHIYGALLRRRHGHDPRVYLCFVATKGRAMVRMEGYWADRDGKPMALTSDSAILAGLPACRDVLDSGKTSPNKQQCEFFAQNTDLSHQGYPPLVTVWGIHLSANLAPIRPRIYTVMPSSALRDLDSRKPKYLPSGERMPDDRAWQTLETVFPRCNRHLLRLLIASKGLSECGAGLPPMLVLTGPTGAGKTVSARLAAALCGDSCTTVTFSTQPERVRAGLIDAKRRGTYAVLDEFLKAAKEHRRGAEGAMEMLLSFTPDSTSHLLYIGPVPMGPLPVCVWCDTAIPDSVKSHAQLARRLAHCYLPDAMQWEATLREAGLASPDDLRVSGSPALLAAADSIVSSVADAYFPPGGSPPAFSEIVQAEGFAMLRDSDTSRERHEAIRELFRLTCLAPPLTGENLSRWAAPGWKLVELDRDDKLSEMWRTLSDADDPVSSRAIEETDLRAVLALRQSARMETRSHGRKLVIRFAAVEGDSINESLSSL